MAVACSALFGGGCGDGWNVARCRQAVMEELKTDEVQAVPDTKWQFIARLEDGSIWYVETTGPKAEVTARTKLFPAK